MFLSFIPQLLRYKTNIFWICSTIIWYWLFFITFFMWLVPYIGWWRYVWEELLIINIRDFLSNALISHSWIVINFVYSLMITIFQAKKSNTRKNNPENYIAPFPWLIVSNIPNWLKKYLYEYWWTLQTI